MIFEKNVDIISRIPTFKIYMNGILIKEERPVFPYLMLGTEFDTLSVNVKSREYTLNLARSRFDDESRVKMWCDILRMIYEDIKENLNGDEDAIINFAINLYSDTNSEELIESK
ncbi:hypothetical protein CIY_13650 [Butyrivibrio fibrisolvens 16/4]|nr:hypothetical protein CIY_13650 [Butyrivibrio fibrisolvens 16/4]